MEAFSKWGILTDFRYSYFTMMPAYEVQVLERFADLMAKKMVTVGERPVFWSSNE
jgi:isoleucyl-tRNA synthetase